MIILKEFYWNLLNTEIYTLTIQLLQDIHN